METNKAWGRMKMGKNGKEQKLIWITKEKVSLKIWKYNSELITIK